MNAYVWAHKRARIYLYTCLSDHTSRTTYLPIYRRNIDHERATKPYDMPRLPHGFYSFALVRLLLSFFLFNDTKVDPSWCKETQWNPFRDFQDVLRIIVRYKVP